MSTRINGYVKVGFRDLAYLTPGCLLYARTDNGELILLSSVCVDIKDGTLEADLEGPGTFCGMYFVRKSQIQFSVERLYARAT